jgi:hypothetical protein
MPPRVWILLPLLTAPPLVWAQKPAVMPLLPAANWRLISKQDVGLDTVRQWGGDPIIEQEYGVKYVELRTYRVDDVVAEALAEQASDASAAFGLLTYYQTEAMRSEKGTELTLIGPEGALMARGPFFVRIRRPTSGELSENNFLALPIFIGGTRGPVGSPAALPAPIPESGLVPHSEKYLLGLEAARRILPNFRTDLIGFAQGAEVQVGDYIVNKDRSRVVAISYPTPQIARIRFGAMQQFLAVNQDQGPGSLYGRRQGSFVFLVLNSSSSANANRLLEEFRVSQHLSWDQRYPGSKPITLQVVELLLANIALILILISCAVLGGILIFLSRLAAAKWFPDSAWGHPDDGTITTLRLN